MLIIPLWIWPSNRLLQELHVHSKRWADLPSFFIYIPEDAIEWTMVVCETVAQCSDHSMIKLTNTFFPFHKVIILSMIRIKAPIIQLWQRIRNCSCLADGHNRKNGWIFTVIRWQWPHTFQWYISMMFEAIFPQVTWFQNKICKPIDPSDFGYEFNGKCDTNVA